MKDNPTILGIGTDIIEIDRIALAIQRHGTRFLDHIFTLKEQAYAFSKKPSDTTFAGRFAAKEAVSKALGTGICQDVGWKDIEILSGQLGKPLVFLSERVKQQYHNPNIVISISHSKIHATAFALWQA